MIWTIFWINVLTVAVAFKKRMVLYALLNAVFLYLVIGQAFQIQGDLERSHTVLYLLNFINGAGFHLALWYVFGISSLSLALALVSPGYRSLRPRPPRYSFNPDRQFYVFLFCFLCAFSFLLVFVVVGVSQFLNSSRPGFQSGTTIFLVILFVGIIPLLLKIVYQCRIEKGDIACFLVSFVITGAFSRTDLLFFLVAILLAQYYCGGWVERKPTFGLIAKFLGFGIAASFIIVVIGALHSAQNYTHGSLGDLVAFLIANPEKSVLSIEYNYRVGIEGMSGIAGIFTQYLDSPLSAHHDFGASWVLQGLIQGLPGFLKPYAGGVSEASVNLNWYPFSIVATAAETFFMSFGWLGIVVYPITLYCISWGLPLKAMQAPLRPLQSLLSYELMAWTILFVHGPLAAWIAVCIFYSLALILFWPMFKRHIRQVEA